MELSSLAIPAVFLLISFLAYSSQYLFLHIAPGVLDSRQTIIFNVLVACLLISYCRSCFTDPGRIPRDWAPTDELEADALQSGPVQTVSAKGRQRWCRKCEAIKPPRAHHCKVCKRCVLKMDHHCPWTANCVSHVTFPHFVRFLFYAVAAMAYLEHFLYLRAGILWENRTLPSYLGPTVVQLIHMFLLVAANSLTLFALSILLIRTIWCLGANTTTIEGWEIERHETLVRRARYLGGYLDGPDGKRIRIVKQEFPYDIGIWNNFKQGMGTGNILAWFWPLSASPSVQSGLAFETNGFEDRSVSWPPPDPDRMPRVSRQFNLDEAFTHGEADFSDQHSIEAFRQRQEQDLKRWNAPDNGAQRRKPFHQRYEVLDYLEGSDGEQFIGEEDGSESGEEGWKNAEGERLRDFGVDEDVEFYDEDELPLSELMRRRKLRG